uniref:hypothetical protein n=1 Tax=Escherichia coli TaxID=562 RepID=UPI0035A6F135
MLSDMAKILAQATMMKSIKGIGSVSEPKVVTVKLHTHILSVLVLIRTPLRLVHMDIPSPLTLLVTRKTPSKTSHLTIL